MQCQVISLQDEAQRDAFEHARCVQFLVQGAQSDADSERPAWSVDAPLPEQWLFTKALARLDSQGRKTNASSGQAYCHNRHQLDQFMSQNVENIRTQSVQREIQNYHHHADQLGLMYQGQCRVETFWTPGFTRSRSSFIGEDPTP